MATFCERNIRDVAKDLLGEKEVTALLEELKDRAAEKARQDLSKNDEDAFEQAANEIISEREAQAQVAKRHAYMNIIKKRQIDKQIGNFDDKGKGLIAYLDGVQSNIKESRLSTSGVMKATRAKLIHSLIEKMNKTKGINLFLTLKDKALESDLAKELFAEGTTTNKSVRALAKVIKEVYSEGVKLLNNQGAFITELRNYTARQVHNAEKLLMTSERLADRNRDRLDALKQSGFKYKEARKILRKKAFTRWKNFILSRLNEKTFAGVKDIDGFMEELFDDLITGNHQKLTAEQKFDGTFKFKRSANKAAKISEHRVLHFKDGQSWFEYNKKYGWGTVQQAMIHTIESMGDDVGLLKMFGPNPEAMFDKVSQEIRTSQKDDPRINSKLQRARYIFDEITGRTRIPVDHLFAKIGRAARAWTTFSKLGLVLPSSFSDLAIRASVARDHGSGLLESYGRAIGDLVSGKSRDEMKEIADSLGVWAPHQFGNMMRYFSAEDNPHGFTTKAMQNYFKLAGMNYWDRANREGFSIWNARNLAFNRNKSFGALDPKMQRILKTYGIEDKEWDFYRQNAVKPHGNTLFITPDAVRSASEEAIAKALGKSPKELKKFEIRDFKEDMEDRLRTYFIDQADNVIIQPSAGDRALVTRGTQPGTLYGEIARFIGQFKYYSIGYTRRVLGRMLLGQGGDGFIDAVRTGKADIWSLTQLMIGTTILGYVGISAKDMLKGLTAPEPNSAKTWVRSFTQGGGAGIFGDFIFGEARRNGALLQMLGPVLGTVNDVANLTSELVKGNDVGTASLRLLENNTPALNLWFTKMAVDYLFLYGVHEHLHPGYLMELQSRIEDKNGQQFLISPYNALGV